jgi:hypothetical protein
LDPRISWPGALFWIFGLQGLKFETWGIRHPTEALAFARGRVEGRVNKPFCTHFFNIGESMEPEPQQIAKIFCDLCNWAYECWITHRKLFVDNPDNNFFDEKAPYFHERLQKISHEYALLQICKLHDRADSRYKRAVSYSLTIDYLIDYFPWGDDKESIKQIAKKLDELNCRLNPARNKVIAHNDRDTLLRGEPVGGFREGLDNEYFQSLQEFVTRVHEKWVGGSYLFKDMNAAEADAQEYLEVLKNSKRTNCCVVTPTS